MSVARLRRFLLSVLAAFAITVLTRALSGLQWEQCTRHSQRDFTLSRVNDTRTRTPALMNLAQRVEAAYAPVAGRVNPHNFRLVLDEPLACSDTATRSPRPVFLLVLVASAPGNSGRRQAIRETWGSPRELGGLAVVTLFLLGASRVPAYRHLVRTESARHRDLLMEDFVDSYKNLTLKTVMAMKWASTHCPQAAYVMKTDDDMFVSYRNLLGYLAAPDHPHRPADLALGFVIAGQAPIRTPRSKWYVPRDVWPGDSYPPWLSGGGFVLSGDVPAKVYRASLDTGYLPLEDVFVGVCLDRLGIAPVSSRRFSNSRVDYSYCRFRSVITAHSYGASQLRAMWQDLLVEKPCWLWT